MRPCEGPAGVEDSELLTGEDRSEAEGLQEFGCAHLQHGRFAQAVVAYRRLVELNPEDPDGHYYLGVALAKMQKKEAAAEAFEKSLSIAPDFVEALWSLGLLDNERGDGYEDAMRMLDRAVALAPQQAYCHFIRGFILFSRGHDDRAVAALQRAIDLDESLAHARYYLGLVYQRKGDVAAATAAFEGVIDTDPLYAQAYYSLASLYASAGRLEDGARMASLFQEVSANRVKEEHYRRILYQQAPADGRTGAANHYNLGQVYLKRHLLEKALHEFEAAVELDPDNAEAAHNLGVLLSQRGQAEQAIPLFLRAVQVKPEYGLAWENLGNSYLATGEYAEAERAFRQAVSFYDDPLEATYALGTALIQQGKIAEGRACRAAAKVPEAPVR